MFFSHEGSPSDPASPSSESELIHTSLPVLEHVDDQSHVDDHASFFSTPLLESSSTDLTTSPITPSDHDVQESDQEMNFVSTELSLPQEDNLNDGGVSLDEHYNSPINCESMVSCLFSS